MRAKKTTRPGKPGISHLYDRCQTPPYALAPLLPYLPDRVIWEPAAGEGLLVRGLMEAGFTVIGTDILMGDNFFETCPPGWDVQVTNPPFSTKYHWLAHSYDLGRPFALLMPVEVLGAARAQRLFAAYGVEVILLDKRVNFKMPNLGWSGRGAHFASAWFTWGLGLGQALTFAHI